MASIATSPTVASSAATSSRPTPQRRFRYTDNVYFQDGHLITGILALLLFLLVAVSMDAAGYVDRMTILVPVTLGAFALGTLMAFSRFDGFFALSHSLFTGLAWILFLMTSLVSQEKMMRFDGKGFSELQANAYSLMFDWLTWVTAAVNNTANEDNYVFVFEIAFLIWWLTFLGVWAIFRYGYTWRAVLPAGVVLVINTYYAPQNVIGFLVIFSLVVLVLLVRTNLAEQQLRWRELHVYFSPDITLDFMRNALIFSVIVLAVAWVAPGLGRSAPVRQALSPVSSRWEAMMQDWNRLYEGLNRQPSQIAPTFGDSFDLGGARNVQDRPVFQVATPVGRYWRAITYDLFNGQGWENTADAQYTFDADTALPVTDWIDRQALTQTVTLMTAGGTTIYGAPDIRTVDVPINVLARAMPGVDGSVEEGAQPLELSVASSRRTLEAGDSYTVVSNYASVTEAALRAASVDYPPGILEQYLQLPETFSPRVAATARTVTEGITLPYDQAKAVESFLRDYPYNDNIPAPPDGADPVEYFLYDIQSGYCDYYATSMVVMLRSLGIPARMAGGYAEGTYDADSGIYIITDRDAHTWVEVYFPAYGWIEFEPTAGENPLNRPDGSGEFQDGPIPGMPDEFENPETNPMQDPLDDPTQGLDEPLMDDGLNEFSVPQAETNRLRWLWALLTPLLLIAAAFLLFRDRFFGPTNFTPELLPIVFDRVQNWAQRLGISVGEQQTPYEQARRIGRAFPEGKTQVDAITESYVLYCFSPRADEAAGPWLEKESQGIGASWQELRTLFWRAWMRKQFTVGVRRKKNPYTLVNK